MTPQCCRIRALRPQGRRRRAQVRRERRQWAAGCVGGGLSTPSFLFKPPCYAAAGEQQKHPSTLLLHPNLRHVAAAAVTAAGRAGRGTSGLGALFGLARQHPALCCTQPGDGASAGALLLPGGCWQRWVLAARCCSGGGPAPALPPRGSRQLPPLPACPPPRPLNPSKPSNQPNRRASPAQTLKGMESYQKMAAILVREAPEQQGAVNLLFGRVKAAHAQAVSEGAREGAVRGLPRGRCRPRCVGGGVWRALLIGGSQWDAGGCILASAGRVGI